MAYSLRKIQVMMATLAMTATGYAQGSTAVSCEEACTPISCCSESCGQFFAGAEFLYLRAFEGGLSNVCDSTDTVDFSEDDGITSVLRGKSHDPDFNWNPGFRIGAGFEFADERGAIGALWTHYDSHSGGGHEHGHENKWHIDFNVVDLLYAYNCNPCDCFTFIPYAGVKFAQINQKLHTHFFSTHTDMDGTFIDHSRGRAKEEFLGVGPFVGIEGVWGLGCGFSVYGDISVAGLYGTFHVKSHSIDQFDTGRNINLLKKHTQACQAVVDAGFGIRWQTCFCDDKVLLLQLGLEQHRYFNHNQICSYGDLVLDGVSIGVGFEY